MFQHEVTLSETNSHGWVALCQCGWIGPVAPTGGYLPPGRKRGVYPVEVAQAIACAAHNVHLEAVRADIAAASDAALKSNAEYVQKVAPTVRRLGRSGRG